MANILTTSDNIADELQSLMVGKNVWLLLKFFNELCIMNAKHAESSVKFLSTHNRHHGICAAEEDRDLRIAK